MPKNNIKYLIDLMMFSACFQLAQAHAGFLPENLSLKARHLRAAEGTWLVPNELTPENSKPILSDSIPGIYVSVGAERSFMGAALSNATHLLILDRDPKIIRYSLMNVGLLWLARSREDYIHLRMHAGLKELLERVQLQASIRNIDGRVIDAMNHEGAFDEFRRWVASKNRGMSGLVDSADPLFGQSSYAKNEVLFQRIQSLVIAGRVEALEIDFNHKRDLMELVGAIQQTGLSLSVLDLSNILDFGLGYITTAKAIWLLDKFQEVAKEDSILITTWPSRSFDHPSEYWGYTFDRFKKANMKTRRFLELIQRMMGNGSTSGSLNLRGKGCEGALAGKKFPYL